MNVDYDHVITWACSIVFDVRTKRAANAPSHEETSPAAVCARRTNTPTRKMFAPNRIALSNRAAAIGRMPNADTHGEESGIQWRVVTDRQRLCIDRGHDEALAGEQTARPADVDGRVRGQSGAASRRHHNAQHAEP
jgi:hypothetical protein